MYVYVCIVIPQQPWRGQVRNTPGVLSKSLRRCLIFEPLSIRIQGHCHDSLAS